MQAEEERAAAAAKREFFTRALGDLRLTQSKVTRAVVEAQQRWVGVQHSGRRGACLPVQCTWWWRCSSG